MSTAMRRDVRHDGAEAMLQLHERRAFERHLPRSLLFGALVAAALSQLPAPFSGPLPVLGAAVLGVTTFVGDRLDRLLLSTPAVLLWLMHWLPGTGATWQLALAGAMVGGLWVQAERCRLRHEDPLSPLLPGPLHQLAAALVTAGLAVGGERVTTGLSSILNRSDAPTLLVAASAGACLSLFVSLGRLAGHLALEEDPLRGRVRRLIAQSPRELAGLMQRALGAHDAAKQTLAGWDDVTQRELWTRTLRGALEGLVDRAEDARPDIEAPGKESARLRQEIESLSRRLSQTDDAATQAQLTEARRVLEHELGARQELSREQERTLAQLHAGTALLEQGQRVLHRTRNVRALERAEALAAISLHLRALAGLEDGSSTPESTGPGSPSADVDVGDAVEAGLGAGADALGPAPARRHLEHVAGRPSH